MHPIKRLRAERRLSLRELGRLSGVPAGTLSGIERGIREPQILTLAKIADALEVDVEDLYPKATASPSPERAKEERRLLNRVRPLILLMEGDAAHWEAVADSRRVTHDLHLQAQARQQKMTEALDVQLKSLADEVPGWGDRRHLPSRRVRQKLQSAFNRWHKAYVDLSVAFFDSVTSGEFQEKHAQRELEHEQEKHFQEISERLQAGEAG